MKHSYLDKHSDICSPVHTFDTRLKIILAFLSIVIIVSEPNGRLYPFGLYTPLLLLFLLISRIPVKYIFKRLLIIIPFFAFAALFYPLSHAIGGTSIDATIYSNALSIFLKALLSVLLILLLVSSEKFHRLLAGMRKIGLPKITAIVAALMYRYIFILADETMRTNAARISRTPGKLKQRKIKVMGNQIAVIFIRSWERSKIIYSAMLSRGFSGSFYNNYQFKLKITEVLTFTLILIIFLCIRFSKHLYIYLF